jgi:hypothetical protein
MKVRLLVITILLLSLFIPMNIYSVGSTYYVSTTGDDGTGTGTIGNPWLTIQKGVDELIAGDTLYVRGGTYAERVQIHDLVGDLTHWTTVSNYPGETAIIDGNGLYAPMQIYDDEYLLVNGFEIKNSTTRWGIGATDELHYITLSNLTIHNTQAGAIYLSYDDTYNVGHITNILIDSCHTYDTNIALTGEAISLVCVDQFEIKNCLVEDTQHTGDTQQAGIDAKVACTNGSIHDNEMNNVGAGVYISNMGTGETSDIDIYNNIIHDCMCLGSQGILLDSETAPQSMFNINIYNNILYNNYRGITVY